MVAAASTPWAAMTVTGARGWPAAAGSGRPVTSVAMPSPAIRSSRPTAIQASTARSVATNAIQVPSPTASAYPGFVAAARGIDAGVYNSAGFSPPPAAVRRLPQVIASAQVAYPQALISAGGRDLPSSWSLAGSTGNVLGRSLNRWKILAGRLPDPNAPGQALVSYDPGYGIGVGSVLHLAFYAPAQARSLFSQFGALPVPGGSAATVRVVGIEASVGDFPAGSSPSQTVYLTPALVRRVEKGTATAVADGVRMRDGAASIAAFTAAVARLPGGAALYVNNGDGANLQVQHSIRLQAVAWWVLAAVAGLAGAVVIAQVLTRQAAADAADYPRLRALGMRPGDLLVLGLARMAAMALAGTVAAIGVAVALSPLTPVGEAAVAESSPGLFFDAAVLLPGMLLIFLAVLALGAAPARLQAFRRGVPGHQAGPACSARLSAAGLWLARAGGSASAVIGIRYAFERGRGRDAVPVVTAFLGATLGVVALAGTAVFGASLAHLLATPRLYGGISDLQIENPDGHITSILPALRRDHGIGQISGGTAATVRIRGVAVDALAERSYQGALLEPPIIAGHAPAGPRQIVLGDTTLRQVGAQVGERVPVTVGGRTVPFTVVGTAVVPDFGVSGGLGTGAGMTFPGYLSAAGCGTGSSAAGCYADGIVITLAPGTGRAGALARLETAYGNGAVLPAKPTTLVNFGQVADLPLILGLAVALFGSGTLLHFLFVSAARRRREVGTLKALGFVRRQVAAAVACQSIAVVVVAIALGMPLGIAAGRLGWDLAASSFGVVDQIAIPARELATIAAAAVVLAVAAAAGPAIFAAGLRPAALLRAE